jgi:hypothetical protein
MKKTAKKSDLWDTLGPFSSPTTSGTLEERVDSIPDDIIPESSMPIGVYVQEAYNIALYAEDDKELFKAKGFDWRIVEELPKRIELLRKYEALWWKERFGLPLWQRELNTWLAFSKKIKNEIIRDLEFAFPDDTDVRKIVKKIRKGSGNFDILDDLSFLHAMADKYSQGLRAIGSRSEIVSELAQCLEKLSHLMAVQSVDDGNSLRKRNCAYVFCAAGLEALRRCAYYALWDNKERLKGYSSEYFRKSARKKINAQEKTDPNENATDAKKEE